MSAYDLEDIKAALLECVLDRYSDVPAEDEIDYTFSDKFEKWGQKMIKRTPDKKVQGSAKFSSRSIKIAILIAALIAALAMTALAVPAIREAIVDFFLNDRGDSFGITFDPEQAKDAPDMVEEYRVPQYVPDGFELITDDKSIASVFLLWRNENSDLINYCQTPLPEDATKDNWIGLNAENVERKDIVICGYQVVILQAQDRYTAIWTDNEYFYLMLLSNSVPFSEFERMLGSIKPVSQ